LYIVGIPLLILKYLPPATNSASKAQPTPSCKAPTLRKTRQHRPERGAITSSAEQSNNKLSTASLTFSDLDNHQDTSASSSSISLGNSTSVLAQVGTNLMANLAGQVGLPESGSQSSKTQSVISPATVTITGTSTGDTEKDKQSQANSQANVQTLTSLDASTANQSLKNTLTLQDAAKLQQDLKTAQQNQQAAQLVGSVMDNMIGDLAIEKTWAEGSTEKTVLHGLSGLVQASIAGGSLAAGAAAGALNEQFIPLMRDYLQSQGVAQYIKDKNGNDIPNPQFADLMKIGSTLLGAGVGALAGGSQNVAVGASVALTGTTENYLKHPQILAKEKALDDCSKSGNVNVCRSEVEKQYNEISRDNTQRLENCENTQACRAAINEMSQDYAQMQIRRDELEKQDYKGQLTTQQRQELKDLNLNIDSVYGGGSTLSVTAEQTWRQLRAVTPYAQWTDAEKTKTFTDVMMTLGGLGASGAAGLASRNGANGGMVEPIVTAKGTVNGAVFEDVNQTAKIGATNAPTLIADRVVAKTEAQGKPFPNGTVADSHAEIGVIQQAYNAGKTQGSGMSMTVSGKDVCGYCKGDIAAAANAAGLKSLTVQAVDNVTGLPKTYYWLPGMKSIKEKQ